MTSAPKVRDIFRFLNEAAPVERAEDYDNVGILAGDPEGEVTRALIALDITAPVVREAAECGAQLVVSHHPVIFHPVRAVLRAGRTAALHGLLANGLAAVCMHTNLDLADTGVSDCLAERLGLTHTGILQTEGRANYKKVVVFVPGTHAGAVREAMTAAGAGAFGGYDRCTFESAGSGRFRPLAGAKPYFGREGETARADEIRLETLCAPGKLGAVLEAMRAAHPSEVPAFAVFDDEALSAPYGLGRVGALPESMELADFATFVRDRLGCGRVKVIPSAGGAETIRRAAVSGGSGDESLTEAARGAGADVLVVGELKHSAQIAAAQTGVHVIVAGHFATENAVCPYLQRILSGAFAQTAFTVARENRDPGYFI